MPSSPRASPCAIFSFVARGRSAARNQSVGARPGARHGIVGREHDPVLAQGRERQQLVAEEGADGDPEIVMGQPVAELLPSIAAYVHQCVDGFLDRFGGRFDVSVYKVGVPQRRLYVGMSEEPRDHRRRHAVHHGMARMRETEVE